MASSASAYQIFLMIVNAACVVKDIQCSKQKAAEVIASVMDMDDRCLEDYADDMTSLAKKANEYVAWLYGDAIRPAWVVFLNGPHF